jgi:hypothetical protein
MVINIDEWLECLLDCLKNAYGDRLYFVGHTGSYARGEATESSDIDVNIILDTLQMDDLKKYRKIIKGMPYSDKACGFICGREEIRAWPAHELFQFIFGCRILCGKLDGLVEVPSESDIRDHIRNTVSLIYHEACHRFVFGDDIAAEAEVLKAAYKPAFFVLQEWVYLKERLYIPTKTELLLHIEGGNKEILDTLINWEALKADRKKNPERYFSLLKNWSSKILQEI